MSEPSSDGSTPFTAALICGGLAGTSVDVALFPIDTLKTRLQAPVGFAKAGGFRGIYNGLGAAAAGSAPGAALFFGTYESMKPVVHQEGYESVSHMVAASLGEAAACLVRVPTEVVKAKMQTATEKLGLVETVRSVMQETHGGGMLSGVFGGLYRGYGITLFREVPFAMIQFPLYERFKVDWGDYQGQQVGPLQAAACGSISGGIAGGLTCPLDVVKTRLMLGKDKDGRRYTGVGDVLKRTLATEGQSALWKGLQPRVMWISIGGFVFFGAYEGFKPIISPLVS